MAVTETGPESRAVHGEDSEHLAEMFLDNGWTDGLPIVVPTPERVAAFIDAVGRDPQEVLLRVHENLRDVTIELAAINAVMAGCWPECFPVVVAAVEGWADERWGRGDRTYFYMSNGSTGGAGQLAVVNGPIRHELDMASGVNVYGPTSRANTTIGRALRLIVRNALGMVPGVLDHASQGHPGKHSFCIAENEEESPWEPLHIERGFAADESTVMVYSGRGPEPVENRVSNTAEGILFTIADTMSRVGAMMGMGGPVLAVIGPEHANIIGGRHGWSKNDVKQFLYENFRRSFADMARAGLNLHAGFPRTANVDGTDYFYGCRGPEDIIVVVAGANNAGVSSVITNWAYQVPQGDFIVKPIRPAATAS